MAGAETKPAAWLLTADRYMAEIAEAERIEALAVAARRRDARLAPGPTLPRPQKALGRGLVALAQVGGSAGSGGPEQLATTPR